MTNYFENKVCIVTGSSQGLGREIAKQILLQGGKVVLNGRKIEREKESLHYFSSFAENVVYAAGDVSRADEAQHIINTALEKFGKIDVLINNAGMSAFGNLEDSTPKVIEEVISSNLVGSLLITHFAIPHLKKQKGSIQFISSLTAIHGIGGYSLYSAAKMAYTGAAQAIRIELNEFNVHVGVVYLGFTENDSSKMTLSPEGKLERVPARDGFKVSTQEESALLILNQIAKRKTAVVHSAIGKLNRIVNRFFPRVADYVLVKAYQKNNPK